MMVTATHLALVAGPWPGQSHCQIQSLPQASLTSVRMASCGDSLNWALSAKLLQVRAMLLQLRKGHQKRCSVRGASTSSDRCITYVDISSAACGEDA